MANKTYKDIKGSLKDKIPNFESETVEILADELDRVQALKTLWHSDGGKELLSVLKGNCAATLRKLGQAINNKPTLDELVGHIATYTANLELLATLQDISTEQEISKQLDEAVKEVANSMT